MPETAAPPEATPGVRPGTSADDIRSAIETLEPILLDYLLEGGVPAEARREARQIVHDLRQRRPLTPGQSYVVWDALGLRGDLTFAQLLLYGYASWIFNADLSLDPNGGTRP
jgi:hypothetical protein